MQVYLNIRNILVCMCVCVISLDCKLQPGSHLSAFSFSMSIPEKILNANLLNELRYVSHLSKQNLDSFLYLVLYFAFFFFYSMPAIPHFQKVFLKTRFLMVECYLIEWKAVLEILFVLQSLRSFSFVSLQSISRSGILGKRAWTFLRLLYIFAK